MRKLLRLHVLELEEAEAVMSSLRISLALCVSGRWKKFEVAERTNTSRSDDWMSLLCVLYCILYFNFRI